MGVNSVLPATVKIEEGHRVPPQFVQIVRISCLMRPSNSVVYAVYMIQYMHAAYVHNCAQKKHTESHTHIFIYIYIHTSYIFLRLFDKEVAVMLLGLETCKFPKTSPFRFKPGPR